MATTLIYSPAKAICEHFEVFNLDQIVGTEEFKKIAKKATGFFVNQEGDYTYLWIINKEGMNGYALVNGKLNLWKSRSIHKIIF